MKGREKERDRAGGVSICIWDDFVVCMCMSVCEREREREEKRGGERECVYAKSSR